MTRRNALLGLYALCCLAAMTWPGYAIFGNSIEPFVLGLPFSFVWVIGWVAATFVALLIYDKTDPAGG